MKQYLLLSIFVAAIFCVYRPAKAAQLIEKNDCKFTIHIPGLFSGMEDNFFIKKGEVFTEDEDGKFCGKTSSDTPIGTAHNNECLGVKDGAIVEFSVSWDTIISSDCNLEGMQNVLTYDDAEFLPWDGAGTSNLHGQAFLKTVGGDVKTCAGEDVYLVPANDYMNEIVSLHQMTASNIDGSFRKHIRHSMCDAQGNFTLYNVPAKSWFVITQVTWGVAELKQPGTGGAVIASLIFGHKVPVDNSPDVVTENQGGMLMQMVNLKAGENQVFLTDRDRR